MCSICKLNLKILEECGIDIENVTAFTSDTAANQKKAVRLMMVPWVPCTCHVYELSSAMVLTIPAVAEVRKVKV